MAKVKICDLCGEEIINFPGRWGYKISKWTGRKIDVCLPCMNKFCEWAGLPLQYKPLLPPKQRNAENIAQKE